MTRSSDRFDNEVSKARSKVAADARAGVNFTRSSNRSWAFALGVAFLVLAPLRAQADPQPKASRSCNSVEPAEHDTTHLPPVAKLPDQVSWMTDWAALPETGGWYEMQAMDSCRYHLDPSFKTWHGKPAARVEVGPGDDPLDLKRNTERAEGVFSQTAAGRPMLEDASSGKQFYATSYFFPTDWAATQYPWSAFAPKNCRENDENACNSWSAVLQFHYARGGPWGGLQAARNSVNGPQRYVLGFGNKTEPFSDGGLIALGKWSDFVFEIQWDIKKVSAWRRDQGLKEFVQILDDAPFPELSEPVYLKQGLYRGGAVGGRTDVFWIGPTVRASSFEAAAGAAFGDTK